MLTDQHFTYRNFTESIFEVDRKQLFHQLFEKREVLGRALVVHLLVVAEHDKRVHERHVEQAQKERLVVFAGFVAELHAVALHPQLIVHVNTAHPAVIVPNQFWGWKRLHLTLDSAHCKS